MLCISLHLQHQKWLLHCHKNGNENNYLKAIYSKGMTLQVFFLIQKHGAIN